jgi:hypothetical protein
MRGNLTVDEILEAAWAVAKLADPRAQVKP